MSYKGHIHPAIVWLIVATSFVLLAWRVGFLYAFVFTPIVVGIAVSVLNKAVKIRDGRSLGRNSEESIE